MAKSKLTFDNPIFTTGDAAESEPTEKKKRGRPRREELIRDISAQEGLTEDYTRFTVICNTTNLKDLRDYAYTKRIPIKQAFDEIIEKFFQEYRSNPKNEKLLDHTRGNKK